MSEEPGQERHSLRDELPDVDNASRDQPDAKQDVQHETAAVHDASTGMSISTSNAADTRCWL
jgi:hypothetical protein